MIALRRTWLLWRAARYRRRAETAVNDALDDARRCRQIAADLERRAMQLTTGERK